jgi:hypothetical protein
MDDMSDRFTAVEICDILKQCHAMGVVKVSIGDFKAKFYVDRPLEKTNQWSQPEPQTSEPDLIKEYSDEVDLTAVNPDGNAEMLNDLRAYELMTNDPVAFEQMMIDQQLERLSEEEADNAETRYWPT